MDRREMIFEMMKSVAPVLVQEGLNLQKRIIESGGNPAKCTIGDKSIPEAYAESARIWTECFISEFVKNVNF